MIKLVRHLEQKYQIVNESIYRRAEMNETI